MIAVIFVHGTDRRRLTDLHRCPRIDDLVFLSTTDVPQNQRFEQLTLRLAAPAHVQMPLIYGLAAGVPGILELFDIAGRRIRTMHIIWQILWGTVGMVGWAGRQRHGSSQRNLPCKAACRP